jgi:hypothetical protein
VASTLWSPGCPPIPLSTDARERRTIATLPPEHRCPECTRSFPDAPSLSDHALTEHVQAETPAAGIRRPRLTGVPAGILAGLGIVAGIALWGFVIAGLLGDLDKAGAPESPRSIVHKMAESLVAAGEIEGYRAVEPDSGWDVEYELDEDVGSSDFGLPDGVIRIKDEGTALEEVEFEAGFSDDLYEAIEDELRRRGFALEDG